MTAYRRRAAFTLACAGMLVFGVVLTSLGAVLPEITERFGVSKAAAGSLFTLLSLGILVGSLVFGPWVDRAGYRTPLAAGIAVVAMGLELLAFGASIGALRAGVALIGFGGGIVNGGTNALVADISTENKAAALSLLGVFFGVGAVGMPFALGILTGTVSYTSLLALLGALTVLPLIATLLIGLPAPKQPHSFPINQVFRLLKDPPLLILGAMLFLQSGMEITMGGWSATFAREELALGARAALLFLSLYWLGMMSARLALGSLLKRMAPASALLACIGIGLVGSLLLLTSSSIPFASTGIFLVGAGFAAGFPVVLGWIGERYAALSGTAISIALIMALSGGMLLPYLAGVIGGAAGLRSSLVIVPIALLGSAMLLISLRAKRLLNVTTQ
ncbi:MAG TPA: MFS transporter [Longimicrobiales bacterium]|nr:MFS transporter [Longimicrobiales bacterium]